MSSAGLMADVDDVNTPYEPPPSLWQLIESCTSCHELPEVKRLLGESLVEQSQELHEEVRHYFVVNNVTSSCSGRLYGYRSVVRHPHHSRIFYILTYLHLAAKVIFVIIFSTGSFCSWLH